MFYAFSVYVTGIPWFGFDVKLRVNINCCLVKSTIMASSYGFSLLSIYCRASLTQLLMASILLFVGQFVKDWTSKSWFYSIFVGISKWILSSLFRIMLNFLGWNLLHSSLTFQLSSLSFWYIDIIFNCRSIYSLEYVFLNLMLVEIWKKHNRKIVKPFNIEMYIHN